MLDRISEGRIPRSFYKSGVMGASRGAAAACRIQGVRWTRGSEGFASQFLLASLPHRDDLTQYLYKPAKWAAKGVARGEHF